MSWNLTSSSLVCCKRRSQCGLIGTVFLDGWKELISPYSWCCVFLASHWTERRSDWEKNPRRLRQHMSHSSKLPLPVYNTRHTREVNGPQSYLYLTLLSGVNLKHRSHLTFIYAVFPLWIIFNLTISSFDCQLRW